MSLKLKIAKELQNFPKTLRFTHITLSFYRSYSFTSSGGISPVAAASMAAMSGGGVAGNER